MSVLIGLAAAASFGSGDFLGGAASRRSRTPSVLALSQGSAVVVAVVYAFGFPGEILARDLSFGAAAGALNVVGLGCLYQGLATGRMGVVAPVTAMVGAVIPIAWGLGVGERPAAVALVGIALVVIAGGLIGAGRDSEHGDAAGAFGWSLAAAAGFGASLIFFAEVGTDSGFWPVLTARTAGVPLVVVAVVVARTPWMPVRLDRAPAVGAGFLDVTATALLLVALRRDLLTIVAPIADLAPAFTVVLAWMFLRERVGRIQLAGVALALGGLVLIASG